MHPLFWILGGYLLLRPNGTTSTGASSNVLAQLKAQLQAQNNALQNALKAQAQQKAQGGGGASGDKTGAGGAGLAPQSSFSLSSWLSGVQKSASQDQFQTVPIAPISDTIDSVSTPDPYSFTPDANQETLMILDSNALDAAQSFTPDYTADSGLTDMLDSTAVPDYQIPTVAFPADTTDTTSGGGFDAGGDWTDAAANYSDFSGYDPAMGEF